MDTSDTVKNVIQDAAEKTQAEKCTEAEGSAANVDEQKDCFACETLSDVWDNPPPRSPELVNGLLRQGHKMIISGTSKAGKSFALLQLAAALAEGRFWMKTFQCKQSVTLYLNMEIERPSMICRIKKVYEALGWNPQGLQNLVFTHLRGKTAPILEMEQLIIKTAKAKSAGAIIIDPVYKCGLDDENSAGDIANFCRVLDQIATQTGAAVIYCHHFSKGAQDGKSPLDRASGSGVFTRDADAILAFTELQEPGGFRLDCILREFKSPSPRSFRFEYPLHIPAPELNECPLKGARTARSAEITREKEDKDRKKTDEQKKNLDSIVDIAKENVKAPKQKTDFVEIVMGKLGISRNPARGFIAALINDGRLAEVDGDGKNRKIITIPEKPTQQTFDYQ